MILPIKYEAIHIDAGYRIDMVVGDSIIIENKTVEKLLPIHEAQLLTYLKMRKCKVEFSNSVSLIFPNWKFHARSTEPIFQKIWKRLFQSRRTFLCNILLRIFPHFLFRQRRKKPLKLLVPPGPLGEFPGRCLFLFSHNFHKGHDIVGVLVS